ncbi:hypothetical protein [Achromobacter insolitus]|uniref:hypothetical protein n=1 Tax=Achromobacter insolitus TaxID=217204 RepID=UPI0007C2B41D|nr:hypothetical protein [Achromobacter insolitus]OAD17143.1 hypothetical protein A3839_24385 [Achromobacter insolitus]
MTPLERKILYRLRVNGALDIFQLREMIRANLHDVRVAARELNARELVHISTWHRRPGGKRMPAYSPGAGENVGKEDVDYGERARRAFAETDQTVSELRESYQPGTFDPFRVLRAQVAA